MSFNKPFRAVPIQLGERYRRKQREADRKASFKLLSIAAAFGAIIGASTLALNEDGRARIVGAVKPVAVQAGLVRRRQPQTGDVWRGCNDARAAGIAPIYSGEPGYREDMGGDGDAAACEPYQ
jgi:hypothetical protein